MSIDPLLLNVKPISEITTVDNPTNGHLLFYDGGDELKKVDISEFQSLIGGIAKPLAITDASPTVSGWYKPTTSGTYANAGGLVAQVGYDTLFYRDSAGVWSKVEVAMPNKTIEDWSAKAFTIASFVYYNGKIYYNATTAASTDVPGTSAVWVEIMGGDSENELMNGGKISGIYFDSLTPGIAIEDGGYKFTGNYTKIIEVEQVNYDRYFIIKSVKNIVGSPHIGFNNMDWGISTFPIEVGKVYKMEAGWKDVYFHANGGSAQIEEVYLGSKPFSRENKRTIKNYFKNINLNKFENVLTDVYGNKKIHIQGNGQEQQVSFIFDKTNEGDYFSILYKSNLSNLKIETGYLNINGGKDGTYITNAISLPNSTHVIRRAFDGNIQGVIKISFTGTTSDYLEVFAPAITTVDRFIDDELINVYEKEKGAPFDTVYEALYDNPVGVFQVGRHLLTRKKANPTLKTDFSIIGRVTEPQPDSKLMDLKYVDLGSWLLMLVTSDRKFIFMKNREFKYTYDIDSVLTPVEHGTEKRYTLNEEALTPMFTTTELVFAIRELGNKELVFLQWAEYHLYTTNGQTVLNNSTSHPATIGNRIDGWAVDAFGDTVVFCTYSPAGASGYGYGSVILSKDGGKTYTEVFKIEGATILDSVKATAHLHGVFIDAYRETIFLVVGDYELNQSVTGKILVLKNYKTNSTWEIIPQRFIDGPREQYCTGIVVDEKTILFGTDMNETCVARMSVGEKTYDTPRESATPIHYSLDFVPNFTRSVEPNAPIGIHYSKTMGDVPSSIYLTKDGFNFAKIYTDTVPHRNFANNNARVWCTVNGDVYCTQFGGRFTNELIIGKYNGYNMI